MEKAAKKHNIFRQFLEWYFIDQSLLIFKAWINYLRFNFEYFSIPLLLKTFFSPWRRYIWSYGRGFNFKRYLDAFVSNAIFRGLGAILRFFLIVIGIILEAFVFLAGIIVLALWFFSPFIIISTFVFGLYIFFNL